MDRKRFFDAVRGPLFGGTLTSGQVDGCETLLTAFESAGWPLAWAAYGLATAKWETAHTMQPVAEYGKGKGRKYGVIGRYGQIPYGRGHVQLTWDANYERADKELGLNGRLLKNFDLALVPEISAAIMVSGMQGGWFTGKKMADYLDRPVPDYLNARRIINGIDKFAIIASIARTFESALRQAGYVAGKPATAAKPDPATTPTPKPALPQPARPASPAPVKPGFWSRFVAALLRRSA